jgi:hypothetical protein
MKIIPSSPSSFSAKCTIPLLKSAGRTSTSFLRSAFVLYHPSHHSAQKIHRKRLSVLFRPNRQGARRIATGQHRRKGALGEFTFWRSQQRVTFCSTIDGAPSAFGNQLFGGFPSFRTPQGGPTVCRKCVTIWSPCKLYRNRGQSEYLLFYHLIMSLINR